MYSGYTVGTPPPLIKGGGGMGGVGPSRNWVTWGGSKIFAGKEGQPWKGGEGLM